LAIKLYEIWQHCTLVYFVDCSHLLPLTAVGVVRDGVVSLRISSAATLWLRVK